MMGWKTVRSLLFPPRCVSCGSLLDFGGIGEEGRRALCPACEPLWREERERPCERCRERVDLCKCQTEELILAGCRELRKLVYYDPKRRSTVQNRVIYRIKDGVARRAEEFLAAELAEAVRQTLGDAGLSDENTCIVYLPRSRRAAAMKGTDQGKRLAYALSRETGIAVLPVVRRLKSGKRAQKKLSLAERRKNARLSFGLRYEVDLKEKTVLVVDDIVTTGTSAAAVIRMLRRMGCRSFYCFAVAADQANQSPDAAQPSFRI